MTAPITQPNVPVFKVPSGTGQLSNTHGGDFGVDALPLLVNYSIPAGSAQDPCTAIRVLVQKNWASGAETKWDSGVVGNVPFVAPDKLGATPPVAPTLVTAGVEAPLPGGVPSYPVCVANGVDFYGPNKRVYASFGTWQIWSAPVTGSGVAEQWRLEADFTTLKGQDSNGGPGVLSTIGGKSTFNADGSIKDGYNNPPYQMFSFGGYISVLCISKYNDLSGPNLMDTVHFKVNPDGTLILVLDQYPFGGWVTHTGIVMGPTRRDTVEALVLGGIWGTGTATTSVFRVIFDRNGRIVAAAAATQLPVALRGLAGFFDPVQGKYFIIGGDDGTNTVGTIYRSNNDKADGAWTTLGTGLPAPRARHSVVTANGYAYVIGGQNAGTAQSTVYWLDIASIGTSPWNVSTNPLPNAMQDMGAVTTVDAAAGTIGVFGGTFSQKFSQGSAGGSGVNGAWYTSVPSMTVATVGGAPHGGSYAVNPDGTTDIGFDYGGFGPAAKSLADGDTVQVNVTLYENLAGYGNRVTTLLRIGQPPTLSAIVPADTSTVTTGNPTVSFQYNPGAGGGYEKSYRIQVKQQGTVIFDTGLMYDGKNSAVVKPPNGQALGNLTYTLVLTVTAIDVPVPGSTATVVSTTTFNGPSTTIPDPPTAFRTTPDGANGWNLCKWVVPAASAVIRIYRKLAGTATWMLYKDNIVPGTVGQNQTFQAMDDIAFNVAYDFAVSSVNAAGVESALALDSFGPSTLTPPKQPSDARYSVMLHATGNGPAVSTGLQLVQIGSRGHSLDVVTEVDAQAIVGFNNVAPTIREGIYKYRTLNMKPLIQGAAALARVEAVMTAAFTGSTICYRDTLGTVIYCGPANTRTRHEGHFHEDDLTLIETNFKYAA